MGLFTKKKPNVIRVPKENVYELNEEVLKRLLVKDITKKWSYPIYLDLSDQVFLVPNVGCITILHPETVKEIDVRGNKLVRIDMLDAFVRLKRFNAGQNELRVALFPTQSHLVSLDLSQNQLGPNPPDLSACVSLEYLNLSYNSIRMHIADDETNTTKNTIFAKCFGKCTQLRELNLSYNQIEWTKDDLTEVFNVLKTFKKLQSLHFLSNSFSSKLINYNLLFLARIPGLTHFDGVLITRKDRNDVKQNPNQEVLFLDDFVSSLKEGKLVTSASRKYPSFSKLFPMDKNVVKPSFEDLHKVLSDTNKVYLMVAAQKLEQTLNTYALKNGAMRSNGLTQYLDLMKDYVIKNANVAGTFIRCILLSAFFVTPAFSNQELIRTGRFLMNEFNSDTIESLNRIIVPYLNSQPDEEADVHSAQHLSQLLRMVREMRSYSNTEDTAAATENLLRFFSAMLNTLSRNLKPSANLCYLRLLYEAADILNTENTGEVSVKAEPLPPKFYKTLYDMYEQERNKNVDSQRLITLLRIMSVTPNQKAYEEAMEPLWSSIKSSTVLTERRAWECVTYASLGGTVFDFMHEGINTIMSKVDSLGDSVNIGLFGYLKAIAVSKNTTEDVIQFLSENWIGRFCKKDEYGMLCLQAVLAIIEQMTKNGYKNDKLPLLLLDIILHPHTNHKTTALRIMSTQDFNDTLVKRVIEYISKNNSEEMVLVMKVLEMVIKRGSNKTVEEGANSLFTHLFTILLEPRSPLAQQALVLIELLIKLKNIKYLSDMGEEIVDIFCKAMCAEEVVREKQISGHPLLLENLTVLANDSKTLLSCLQSLTVGSTTFLKLFIRLSGCTDDYGGMSLIENVIFAINKKRDAVNPLTRKLTQQRLSLMRRSVGASTTSFGANFGNQIEETDKQAPRITINRRNSTISHTDNSIFNSEYSNYFWSERGFLNTERRLFRDVASYIESLFKSEKEAIFKFYEKPTNAFLITGSENLDDEFVLSSDEDDELSDITDDEHKLSQKYVSDMEGTLFSCDDFYRLVFNDDIETDDAYLKITGEASSKSSSSNGWFLAGPQVDYSRTRHILSAIIAARILLQKQKSNTIAPVVLLESLYRICAMFQFLSLRVNFLCILIMQEIELTSDSVLDVATQILQQMNSAMRKRFQFRANEPLKPLTIPERTFLYHYTSLWYSIITHLRFINFFPKRIENCDDDAMASLNQICRVKLLGVLLPLPDLAILIRILHYNSLQKESNSLEYTLFGRERQQIYGVFSNEALEQMVQKTSSMATTHEINSNLVSIISEYIVLDHYNLYNILDFIVRLEVNSSPLRASLFQGILDLQSHLKERNDLEQLLKQNIYVFEYGEDSHGVVLVILTDAAIMVYSTVNSRFLLTKKAQLSYKEVKVEYQKFTSSIKLNSEYYIPNGRKLLQLLRSRCHVLQFVENTTSLEALGSDVPIFGSRVTEVNETKILYVTNEHIYVLNDKNKLLGKYPRKGAKVEEGDTPYALSIETGDKKMYVIFPSDRSKVDFVKLVQ
jgi:hypothetical protein